MSFHELLVAAILVVSSDVILFAVWFLIMAWVVVSTIIAIVYGE
jgi:hypothetical protein